MLTVIIVSIVTAIICRCSTSKDNGNVLMASLVVILMDIIMIRMMLIRVMMIMIMIMMTKG